jgi:NMD protein affecting ribosome stability and mRNA decay
MDFDLMILCYDCGCRLREDHVGDLCPQCAARYDEDGYAIQPEVK